MKDENSQAQAVQAIEKSVDTAGNIIDNLLNFSRVSSKVKEEVPIVEHINSVISLNKGEKADFYFRSVRGGFSGTDGSGVLRYHFDQFGI